MTKVLIVSARFYEDIASDLETGAITTLQDAGVEFVVEDVPGAFEIPGAIAFAHRKKKFDGYIALGCVIRGETSHYDYVCGESARGLMELSIAQHAAIGYGILTVENEEQAWERAGVAQGNKGRDAALACLRMIELKKRYE
jgi:6,7-dimethyl-8-ribityllumazine synthase